MFKKLSAQKRLSFKSSSSVPPPTSIGTTNLSIAAASADSAIISTSSTAEESTQSVSYTDTTASPHPSSATSHQFAQGTSVEYLRELVQKRIVTLTYIRNIHEGRSHRFHTILISHADLGREFGNSNPEIRKRTTRFAILGMSLSNLLDINSPQDLLRGIIQTISEYDRNTDDAAKPKMRQSRRLFRSKASKRGQDKYAPSDSSEDPNLMMPHPSFPLDYHQTLLSLLDVISEVYSKIFEFLGPSPFVHPSQYMIGPLGLPSPHLSVSSILSRGNIPARDTNASRHSMSSTQYHSPNGGPEDMSSSLLNTANPSSDASPPTNWSASFGESILEVDDKIRKITSTLVEELDTFARKAIKSELASLDSLLNTVNPTESESFSKPGGGRGRMVSNPSNEPPSLDPLPNTIEPIKSELFFKPGGGRGPTASGPSNEFVSFDPLPDVESINSEFFIKPGGGRGGMVSGPRASSDFPSLDSLLDNIKPIKSELFVKPGGGRGRMASDPSNEVVSFDPLPDVESVNSRFFLRPGGGRGHTVAGPNNEFASLELQLNSVEPIQTDSFFKPGGGRRGYDPSKGL